MKQRYRRIVVKLGTNLLTDGDQLDIEQIGGIVAQVAQLRQAGTEVIVVTSGAVAAGRARLGVTQRRRDIPFRGVLAAVGQGRLIAAGPEKLMVFGPSAASPHSADQPAQVSSNN